MQDTKTKTIAAVHGHIPLHRRYRYYRHCKQYSFPVDVTLGMDILYTERLQRLAAETLQELCGVQLSHTTIGTLADAAASKITAALENNTDFRQDFQKAKGEIEFYHVIKKLLKSRPINWASA